MQLFRPYKEHLKSAQYLDNRRLNKQVLETYQIIRVCLGEMGLIVTNTAYLKHPIVAHIYHEGNPYVIDALAYLQACDVEFKRRGFKRGEKFAQDILSLEAIIEKNQHLFSHEAMPALFVYGDVKEKEEERVYERYRQLLFEKWREDQTPAKCNIHIK